VSSADNKIKELENLFLSDYDLLKQNKIDFESVYNKYLGRKKGLLNTLYPLLSDLDSDKKSEFGKRINNFKNKIILSFDKYKPCNDISEKEVDVDLTLPESYTSLGSIHPITIIIDEIKSIFSKIGFSSVYGSEIDSEYYNFEALNIPKHHPARDMQDTFYINDNILLRTHTSGSQIHFMKKNKPPIRILSPGRVYRNEDISVRSYCLFHQIEGLYVDQNVSFSELKGTLEYFAKEFFGSNVKTRFRPSYFPFTEPSAEMDVYWGLNNESDYRITKGTGWLEILGCGMVDPEVFKSVDYNSEKINGFAFGLGIERIAMLKYGIDDIRLLYEGDYKFLRQFKK
tara:strand:- start:35829 stop:36854 length:1026 start_codon:yes stop_codon:yes gene_type:complete